jgi:DNA (cytosine-5)-methyltransferase 1
MYGSPMTKPTVIDLFAGCGGMTQGFVDAGFDPIAAVEFDLAAAATYAANFGEDHMQFCDIATWRRVIPEADLVIGGPPCQGFSNLGTRDPGDPRNQLWQEYVRIVRRARPKIFVIENVDRFRASEEFALLRQEVESGTLKDYEIVSGVLNAADFGVPQRRRRTIVIGSRIGTPTLPSPTHSRDGGLKEWNTVRSAIEEIPFDTGPTTLPVSTVNFFGETIPGIFKGLDIHVGRNPQQRSLLRYDCIPPGGGRFDLPDDLMPKCWLEKPTGTTDVMGRMKWDAPSLTIRTEFFKPEKGQYLHPQWEPDDPSNRVNRPITHLEAARLQTFPEDFLWCGTKIEIAKQIGNAVPTQLATAIATHLRTYFGL